MERTTRSSKEEENLACNKFFSHVIYFYLCVCVCVSLFS
jgi:hypothetical protein